MRLIKLLAYLLFGYAVYEFVRGMVEEPEPARRAPRASQQGKKARTEGTQTRSPRQAPSAP